MATTDSFTAIDRLEVRSHGDYSFIQLTPSGIARKSVIKHNGGYFYCFADKYEYFKGEIREVTL